MTLAFKLVPWSLDTRNFLTDFVGVPVTVAALLLIGVLLLGGTRLSGAERRAWWMVGAFTFVNLLANEAWVRLPDDRVRALLTFADGFYLADYWILTAAFALFFVSLGGSLRRPLVWLDAATMILVQLVGLWTLLVAPQVPAGVDRHASVAVIVAYSLSFAAMTSMATVLWMQTRSRQDQGRLLLLIAAGWFEVAWEVMWLASWLADANYAAYYYNFGDVLCFCCIATAAAMGQTRAARETPAVHPERTAESFLPAILALLAIAIVAASMASTRRTDALMLVCLVFLCSSLVLTRQRGVRRELRALSDALAQRRADARLTELVRRSADLIAVIDAEGRLEFVSPAATKMLGTVPESLVGTRGVELLGHFHAAPMQSLLDELRDVGAGHGATELRYLRPDGAARTLRVSGVNQLANPLINGLVLTLCDVTDQRSLEREVLEVATRERARLCGDIHDGLGQELVGIAMLLQGEATMPDPDPAVHRAHLKTIVGHVNRAIQSARDLARGLSPLHVVRGSLSGALHRLAHESCARMPVAISIAGSVEKFTLDEVAAEHLYRIAQEAVLNAISHAGCTKIEISLVLEDAHLVMRIDDDGRGFEVGAGDFPGLGLKLMEYRSRLIGGLFRFESPPGLGTRIVVTMPAVRAVNPTVGGPGQRDARRLSAGGATP